jgi:hypothetical protein
MLRVIPMSIRLSRVEQRSGVTGAAHDKYQNLPKMSSRSQPFPPRLGFVFPRCPFVFINFMASSGIRRSSESSVSGLLLSTVGAGSPW